MVHSLASELHFDLRCDCPVCGPSEDEHAASRDPAAFWSFLVSSVLWSRCWCATGMAVSWKRDRVGVRHWSLHPLLHCRHHCRTQRLDEERGGNGDLVCVDAEDDYGRLLGPHFLHCWRLALFHSKLQCFYDGKQSDSTSVCRADDPGLDSVLPPVLQRHPAKQDRQECRCSSLHRLHHPPSHLQCLDHCVHCHSEGCWSVHLVVARANFLVPHRRSSNWTAKHAS
mmetsp:Transcript_4668/g.11764  ORF Transcript_4668/g.11764 Transcript_4668/m.11764 type:complete len:226 (+) Transcript_4668:398-1075(+)